MVSNSLLPTPNHIACLRRLSHCLQRCFNAWQQIQALTQGCCACRPGEVTDLEETESGKLTEVRFLNTTPFSHPLEPSHKPSCC